MTLYLMLMDMNIIILSVSAKYAPLTTGSIYWIVNAVLGAITIMLFSMYFYIRCYTGMSNKEKRMGHIGFPVTFIGIIFYLLGARGFLISNFIGSLIFLVVGLFSSTFTSYILITIIKVIGDNPLYLQSGKQTRLMKVSSYSTIFIYLYCIPVTLCCVIGTFLQLSWSIDVATAACSLIVLVAAFSNFSITANKHCEDTQIKVTGTSLFNA